MEVRSSESSEPSLSTVAFSCVLFPDTFADARSGAAFDVPAVLDGIFFFG